MRNDIFHNSPRIPFDGLSHPSVFNELNSCSGSASEINPEFALKLGYACATVAKRIAISSIEDGVCHSLLHAFISGACIGGAQVTITDADFYAVASYSASVFYFELTVFIENDANKLKIRFFDKDGLPINEDIQKKISLYLNTVSAPDVTIADVLLPTRIRGIKSLFSAEAGNSFSSIGLSVSVKGKTSQSNTLKEALEISGCDVISEEKGVLLFDVSSNGLKLRIRDEKGLWHDESHITALIAYIFFLKGNRTLITDATAPSVMEQIAADCGGEVLRLGRESSALEMFKTQEILKNAVSDAVYICSHISSTKDTLYSLMKSIPDFTLVSREIHINSDKQHIFSSLSGTCNGLYKESADSLRICTDGGWINISPSRTGKSLQITAESFNEEIASELCELYIERTANLDMT